MRIEDLPQESDEFNLTFQSKYILQVFRESFKERDFFTYCPDNSVVSIKP